MCNDLFTIKQQLNDLLLEGYSITLVDAGVSDDEIKSWIEWEETPEEIISWFAEKHGLTHIRDLLSFYTFK